MFGSRIFAFGALVAASVGVATAQESRDLWSLEAMAAQSKVVIRGIITEVLELPDAPRPGEAPKATFMLTIRRQEVLKGRPDSWMTLIAETSADDKRFEQWKASSAPILWFTFSEAEPRAFPGSDLGPGLPVQPGHSWAAVHLGPIDAAELSANPRLGLGSLTMNLSMVKEGPAKLAAVKEFVRSSPARTEVCRLPFPPGLTGGAGHIVLPVTADLEPLAQRMIDGQVPSLPKDMSAADRTAVRAAGIKALVGFKSAKNVARLRSLLNDPAKGPSNSTDSPVRTLFWVRLYAYQVLTGWGVKVAKPVL